MYTPQPITDADERDDTATCLYCNVSLGGWEADDDPMYVLLLLFSFIIISVRLFLFVSAIFGGFSE